MLLNELPIGQTARVVRVGGERELRQHLLDMGVIPGAEVMLEKYAPMGDPIQIKVHGYQLTLRLASAAMIEVSPCAPSPTTQDLAHTKEKAKPTPHPGYGETTAANHSRTRHAVLPKDKKLVFALVGNQNCGKTTLFNQLTGMNQHVGNFPGVTIDTKSGTVRGYPQAEVVDLPGIYSLSPYSNEEIVSRDFILRDKPDAIINIVDATNIERNLYLTMQLMELKTPMVVALNMMDEVRSNGGSILINEMERRLGLPIVPISAAKGEGVSELIEHVVHVAQYQEIPDWLDLCSPQDNGGAMHRCVHSVMHLIEDHAVQADIPTRFAACKLVEHDELVEQALQLHSKEREAIELIISQLEEERGMDAAAAVAEMRFVFISRICRKTVIRPPESKEMHRSRHIDRFLTGRWTALPAFLLIMMVIFWLTFDVIGGRMQNGLAKWIALITQQADALLTQWDIYPVLRSLIINGIFSGVGVVLSFLPIIVVLFFFLSILEDSGYMARIAFVTDKLLRKIGLSGRSIVPLLLGFGCSVPSVLSCRTLPSERDRKVTVMLVPFMSCTAKLPIYAFFTAVFFPRHAALVMILLYLTGIITGVLVALLLKRVIFRGQPVPFVMELPIYRFPSAISVGRLIWDKSRDFLQRAFTFIFMATIVIWFLQTFDWRLQVVTSSHDSMLANVSGWIAAAFAPLGLADWRIVTSLVSGFMAKESVVSTLTVLFGSDTPIASVLTPTTAFTFLVFCLLYTPCVATIATVKREMGSRYAMGLVLWQCAIAWVAAWLVHIVCQWLL
ncbi:MAG: ferrous iron transport protein B [Bacteroidaceae bacterium]|nr:ferrous iron transport protein B [Bacteroidaceae bacterium]